MLKIAQIETAIERLPERDFVQLMQWLWEKDWQKWDRQVKIDSESGRLDFLVKEALDEKNKGQLKEL